MKLLSTKAVCNSHGEDSSYFMGWQEYEKNPYDSTTNTTGIIQMGLAENQLSSDLLELWLDENPEATSFRRNGKSIFRELALFQDYHGLPAFKQSLVSFMSKVRGNKVNFHAENLVVTAGATSANEMLMFCLAEPGEAFLLPTPYYPGFDRDLKWRTGVEIVPVRCCSYTGFRVTKTALEESWRKAQKRGLKVKGVLITNPSNPLGTTATIDELHLLLNFVRIKSIHLISDEIYAGTVFGPPRFVSVMEAFEIMKLNSAADSADLGKRIHIVCSLSKDLGLPGFRVGGIYSNNEAVVAAATKMSSFGLVSSPTQYLLSAILSDSTFASQYLVENKRRLKRRNEMLVRGLEPAGIRCLEGNSGLFSWVDMRHMLKRKTMKGEMGLWKKMLYSVGINISPGSSCHCSEPGWFRVCFANMSDDTLLLALSRIKDCAQASTGRRRGLRNWALRSTEKEEGEEGDDG